MKLNGANLGVAEVEFNELSKFDFGMNEEQKKMIKHLENIYYTISKNENEYNIQNFPVDGFGKVIINKGMINHRCAKDLDTLSFISRYGLLASEWFGILESEREACFCAFVSRMKGEDYPYRGSGFESNYTRLNTGKDVILFFDETNPIMQYLIHLDFFEYEKKKQENPSDLEKIYTKDEIKLFDNLIEPISPGGKNIRVNFVSPTNYWSAIPGGIPPFLINGICIKNNDYTEEEIDKISMLFPNATVFKGNLDIVRLPYKELLETQTREN